ncbi:hypothetical protein V6N13_037539 [Hibiscus sabdariffa]
MHHGGYMVNSPMTQYTGKNVDFFYMCHVDSMSMLDMNGIVEEVGYSDATGCATEEATRDTIGDGSGYVTGEADDVEVDDNGSEDCGSGFEDSENNGSDHEEYAHDVNVNNDFEIGLNNDLLGGCHIRVNDDDVNE